MLLTYPVLGGRGRVFCEFKTSLVYTVAVQLVIETLSLNK